MSAEITISHNNFRLLLEAYLENTWHSRNSSLFFCKIIVRIVCYFAYISYVILPITNNLSKLKGTKIWCMEISAVCKRIDDISLVREGMALAAIWYYPTHTLRIRICIHRLFCLKLSVISTILSCGFEVSLSMIEQLRQNSGKNCTNGNQHILSSWFNNISITHFGYFEVQVCMPPILSQLIKL